MVSQLKHGDRQDRRSLRALKLAPAPFAAELGEWLEFGEPPDDDMLAAVLRNDLQGVVALSPQSAFALPRELLRWLWAYAPEGSFGSPALVHEWQASFDRKAARRE